MRALTNLFISHHRSQNCSSKITCFQCKIHHRILLYIQKASFASSDQLNFAAQDNSNNHTLRVENVANTPNSSNLNNASLNATATNCSLSFRYS